LKKVKDLMTDAIETCHPSDQIKQIAGQMKQWNVGSVPVVEGDKLLGMITDRDIVLRCIAEGKTTSSSVQEIMSKNIVSCPPDATVREAAEMMSKEQVRRLPIVENNALIGMLSLGDLAIDDWSDEKAGQSLAHISENNNQTSAQSH
jgi:CBS domain-containing protein